MSFRWSAAWLSHPGKEREINEDSLLVGGEVFFSREEEVGVKVMPGVGAGLAAVADGLGGSAAGELASRTAMEMLAGWKGGSEELLGEHLRKINRRLYEMAGECPELRGMGTTVAGIAWGDGGCLVFHVGDSRVYRINDGYLQQLTRDDSLAALLAEAAGGGDEGGIRPSGSHELLAALGGWGEFCEIAPSVAEVRVKERADFLICTDGLTDMVDTDGIEECFCGVDDPAGSLTRIKERVMEAGAEDNLTLLWVTLTRVGPTEEEKK